MKRSAWPLLCRGRPLPFPSLLRTPSRVLHCRQAPVIPPFHPLGHSNYHMSTTCSAPHSHPVDAVTPPHSAAAVAGHVTPLPSALCFPWPAQRAAELRSAKMALRRSIKRSLAALSAEDVDAQSARATDRLLSDAGPTSSAVWECPAFAVYLSMASGELRTEPLLRWIFARGRRVFVPVVRSATEMDLLEAHSMGGHRRLPHQCLGHS